MNSVVAAAAFGLFAILVFFLREDHPGGCCNKHKIKLPSTSAAIDMSTDLDVQQPDMKLSKKQLTKEIPPKQAAASKTKPTALSKEVRDAATGLSLPRTKKFTKSDLLCLGVGVRAKSIAIAKVNVYTVGLYVDPKGARGALKKFAGADPGELKGDGSLFKILGQPGGFTKYLHLVFARSVTAQKVVDALTSVQGVDEKILERYII